MPPLPSRASRPTSTPPERVLVLALTCAACGPAVADLSLSRDPDLATLLRVSARTRSVLALELHHTEAGAAAGGPASRAPDTPAAMLHEAVLLGLPEATEISVAACPAGTAAAGGDPWAHPDCAQAELETGPVPGRVPAFALSAGEAADGPPFVLTTVITGEEGDSSVQILDGQGRTTWALQPDWGYAPAARFSRDGEAVLVLLTSKEQVEEARLWRQPLAGGEPEVLPLPNAHHDFVELADGRLAWIAAELREVEGEAVVGDQIRVREPDGTEVVLWSAFDWLAVEENDGWLLDQYPFGVDWTHANGLAHDPDEGTFYLSLLHHRAVVAIDEHSGEVLWILAGEEGGFPSTGFSSPTPVPFGPQHAPGVDDEGRLTLFDNNGVEGSRALALEVDAAAGEARLAWSHRQPEGRRNLLLGDVVGEGDGGALVGWGETGRISRHSAEGALLWELEADQAGVVGKVRARDSLYPPD